MPTYINPPSQLTMLPNIAVDDVVEKQHHQQQEHQWSGIRRIRKSKHRSHNRAAAYKKKYGTDKNTSLHIECVVKATPPQHPKNDPCFLP